MPDLNHLTSVARGIIPAGYGLGTSDPRQTYPAFPGETVQGIPRRIAEFRAGRAAARAALVELGLPPRASPVGADRAPIWPLGLQGSITHTESLCLASIGRGMGIGLDLEPATPLDDDLRPSILRPEEAHFSAIEAKLVFCAKEAAYKAQYARSRQLFDFQTLAVTLDQGQFVARFIDEVPPFSAGAELHGRWAAVDGHFLAVAVL